MKQHIQARQTIGLKIKLLLSASLVLLSACEQEQTDTQEAPISDQKQEVVIAPHKALYDIKMKSKSSDSKLVDISGQMLFEWRQECEAWVTDHHFTLDYQYINAPNALITSDFSNYETLDGELMNFVARRAHDDKVFQELRGYASVHTDTNLKKAIYSKPEGKEVVLSEEVMFPSEHTVKLINKARTGESFFVSDVFDGSDEEGLITINTFIGERVNAMAQTEPSTQIDPALINTPGWKMRLAFFPKETELVEADYEMSIVLHDNGVISDIEIEYKDFSIAQELVAIERLDSDENCN